MLALLSPPLLTALPVHPYSSVVEAKLIRTPENVRSMQAALIFAPVEARSEAKPLKVHFIDVAQGDSILIETPNGRFILIDGGAEAKGETVKSYLTQLDVETIDVVIASHPHSDHIGGLITVLGVFDVGAVWDNGQEHTTSTYYKYISIARAKNYTIISRTYSITIDGVQISVLSPPEGLIPDGINENSVVVKVTYGYIDFLLTGDTGFLAEDSMLNAGLDLDSEVLKVAHHGSKYSTSTRFLNAVTPIVSVISVGDNPYGHPHQETLENLRIANVTVYRTDLHGTIMIWANTTHITELTYTKPYVWHIEWEGIEHPIEVKSNSVFTDLTFMQEAKQLRLEVEGPSPTRGFMNVTIPKSFMKPPFFAYVDDALVPHTLAENATHSYVYFTYQHSIHDAKIIASWVIPEFPYASLTLFTALLLLILRMLRRARNR